MTLEPISQKWIELIKQNETDSLKVTKGRLEKLVRLHHDTPYIVHAYIQEMSEHIAKGRLRNNIRFFN
jgi:predicted transcriptional regulator